jgi:hypothetical protein
VQRSEFARLLKDLPNLSNRIWMHGPAGSELYQEAIARWVCVCDDVLLLTCAICKDCCAEDAQWCNGASRLEMVVVQGTG